MLFVRTLGLLCALTISALALSSQGAAQGWRNYQQNYPRMPMVSPPQQYYAPAPQPYYAPQPAPPSHNPFTGQPNNPYVAPPPQVYVNPGIPQRPIPLNPNITCPGCAVGLQPPPPPRQLPQAPQAYNPYQYSAPSTFAPPSTTPRRAPSNNYNYNNGRPSWVPW